MNTRLTERQLAEETPDNYRCPGSDPKPGEISPSAREMLGVLNLFESKQFAS